MQSDTSIQIGGTGTELITSSVTGKKYAILCVNADAVLTTLTGVDNTNGLTDLGINATTVKQGAVIRLRNGELIKNVTVSSGSVWGVLA